MNVRYRVELSQAERVALEALLSGGKHAARKLKRAPKHASWLNMVEIEIGVLRSQCLDRRIGDRKTLEAEIAAWQCRRNVTSARIKWMFTTQRARTKLLRAYPDPANES